MTLFFIIWVIYVASVTFMTVGMTALIVSEGISLRELSRIVFVTFCPLVNTISTLIIGATALYDTCKRQFRKT